MVLVIVSPRVWSARGTTVSRMVLRERREWNSGSIVIASVAIVRALVRAYSINNNKSVKRYTRCVRLFDVGSDGNASALEGWTLLEEAPPTTPLKVSGEANEPKVTNL